MADDTKTAVMDDAQFQSSLNPEQKTFFENTLKKATEEAVTKYKSEADTARQKAVPEKYELKFGEKSPLDPTVDGEKIAAYCKQNGFSNEQAQAYLQSLEDRAQALTARQSEARQRESEAWRQQVETDKELGGPNLQTTLAHAQRVMDRFAPEGSPLRQFLNESGFGNHPEVVRLIASMGKAMAEDRPSILGGGGRSGSSKEFDAKTLYPKSAMA
jgi:hypothetical protein